MRSMLIYVNFPEWILRVQRGALRTCNNLLNIQEILFLFLVVFMPLPVNDALGCDLPSPVDLQLIHANGLGDVRLSDGRTIFPVGVLWPSRDDKVQRDVALASLLEALSGGALRLSVSGPADRWGRLPAEIAARNGTGLAVEPMLTQGLVAAWPHEPRPACWARLVAAEAEARRQHRGIWLPADPQQPWLAAPVGEDGLLPSRRVVFEGRVRSVRKGRRVLFINFDGTREKTPYLLLSGKQADEFRKVGRDPATFVGKRIVVRALTGEGDARRLSVESPRMVEDAE